MPLYEYQCEACARRFEKIQKFSDPPVEICPHCGGQVRKLLSSPAIQFKGSGWYITDYAKKSSGDGSKSTEGTSTPSDKSAKSESSAKPSEAGGSSADTSAPSKPAAAAKE